MKSTSISILKKKITKEGDFMYKKLLVAGALALSTCLTGTVGFAADTANHQVITKNGEQAAVKGPTTIFNGNVIIEPLFNNIDDRNISGAYVTFEPGTHSSWHTHPKGQVLIVTEGQGLTQEWGQPIQVINPGDVIWCPPGIKHWHGAGYNTKMTHISLCEAVDGANVNWLEQVSDEQYHGK